MAIANFFSRVLGNATGTSTFKLGSFKARTRQYKCGIKFRVVFVSPFFELEVDAGNGWNTVHSQEGQSIGEENGALIYPILRFKSFEDGVKYATGNLGLENMSTKTLGFITSPPASYEKDSQPRIMHPQYIVDGKPIQPQNVQEPAKRLPAFTVYEDKRTEKQAA